MRFSVMTPNERMKPMKLSIRSNQSSAFAMAVAALLCLGGSPAAHAQIGSNWKAYTSVHDIMLWGTGTYSNVSGVETFTIKCTTSGTQRAEKRIHNTYSSGSRQFEGYLRPVSGFGTSMKQIFKFMMIVAYPQNGGTLRQHSSTFLKSGVFGTWIRVNTIHYTATHKAEIWLNGSKVLTMDDPQNPNWHDQYGVYNCQAKDGARVGSVCQSQWRGVRTWKK
jgi:hypothetical protein